MDADGCSMDAGGSTGADGSGCVSMCADGSGCVSICADGSGGCIESMCAVGCIGGGDSMGTDGADGSGGAVVGTFASPSATANSGTNSPGLVGEGVVGAYSSMSMLIAGGAALGSSTFAACGADGSIGCGGSTAGGGSSTLGGGSVGAGASMHAGGFLAAFFA